MEDKRQKRPAEFQRERERDSLSDVSELFYGLLFEIYRIYEMESWHVVCYAVFVSRNFLFDRVLSGVSWSLSVSNKYNRIKQQENWINVVTTIILFRMCKYVMACE